MARLTKTVTLGFPSQKKRQPLVEQKADALAHYRSFRGLTEKQLYNDLKKVIKNRG
jgi:hypothetical protein